MTNAEIVLAVARGTLTVGDLERRALTATLSDDLAARAMTVLREDLSQTQRLAEAAEIVARCVRDRRRQAIGRRTRGHIENLRGRARPALRHYRLAQRWFEEAGSEIDAAVTINGAIQPLIYIEQYDEAFRLAEAAERVFRKADDDLRLARLQVNLANAYHRMDRPAEAVEAYRQAIPQLETAGATVDSALARRNLAAGLMALVRLDEADREFELARVTFEAEGMSLAVREVDFNQAYLRGRQGRYREALLRYREAQRALLETPAAEIDFEVAVALLDQAEFLSEIGLDREALGAVSTASAAFARLGTRLEMGKAELAAGAALLRLGRYEEAETRIRNSRRFFRFSKSAVWRTMPLLIAAEVDRAKGRLRLAARKLERAAAQLSEAGAHERLAHAHLLLAEVRFDQNRLVDAELSAAAAIDALEVGLVRFRARWIQGQVAAARGDASHARLRLQEAEEEFAHVRRSLGGGRVRQAFQSGRTSLYSELFLVETDPARRFQIVQKAKSRTLDELIGQREVEAPDDEVAMLRSRLSQIQLAARKVELAPVFDAPRWSDLMGRRLATEEALVAATPLFAEREGLIAQPGELGAIVNALPDRLALVELFEAGGQLWRLIVTRDGLTMDTAPGGDELIRRRPAARLRLHLARFAQGASQGQERAEALLESVGQAILGDLLCHRALVVCPSASLLGFPLHAALVDGEPIGASLDVSYAPSASVWWRLKTKSTGGGRGFSVVADEDRLAPLIGQEAREVAEKLGTSYQVLGEKAGLASLATELKQSRLVHVAAHGLHREDNPLFSSVRLGQDEVCAYDVARMEARADLVVLSGCSTGLSKIATGDEPTGLIEAFFAAGVRSVIGALWDVDDRLTALAMQTFAQAIRRQEPPRQAYRRAWSQVRERESHPAAWAPFAVFGDLPDSVVSNA